MPLGKLWPNGRGVTSETGQTATCPPKWAMSAVPRYRKRWRTPAAWTSKVRTSAFRSVSGKISRIFLDNFPIGPARALRRAADDFVNHDSVERAVSHQGVRNRQNRRAMLHDQRLGLGKVR